MAEAPCFRRRCERERRAIDAMPFAGWFGAVVKDVAEVAAAAGTHQFGALHAMRLVDDAHDTLFAIAHEKARLPVPLSNLCAERYSTAPQPAQV